jgi:hypothetical protein
METQLLQDARALYERDGFYLHRDPLLSEDEIARVVRGMDDVRDGRYETDIPPQDSYWKPGDPPDKLVKIEMPQLYNRAIFEAVSNRALGELAATLTGARMVQVFWVQELIKPPTDPNAPSSPATNIGWHQDRYYWGDWEPGSELFTAWLALSDVTEEAGPMRFVPGSHKWGLLDQNDFYAQDLGAQRAAVKLKEGQEWREVVATLPPGGVSFHDNLTVHGSGPNHSGRPRRSFAIHLRTEKASPKDGIRQGLTRFIDNPAYCPIIYDRGGA